MSCKTLPSIGAMLSLSACLFLAPFIDAHAQAVPSILGAFSGTFSGQDDSCTPPETTKSFNGNISFTIADQQGSAFTASGTIGDNKTFGLRVFDRPDAITVSGSITANGAVSGNLVVQDGSKATLSGTLSGDTLRFNFTGSDKDQMCWFSGDMTLTRAGSAIIPADAPSNTATTQTEVDAFMRGQPVANSNRIRSVLRGGGNRGLQPSNKGLTLSGMSAGEGYSAPVGAWFGYSYTGAENDFSTTAFKSKRHSVLFGLDTLPADDLLLGVSVGLERSELDTRFNGGEQSITAFTLAPYLGLILNDWLTIDASAGISDVKNDQFRTSGAARISSDVDSYRLFANVNLAASQSFDALRVTGLAGLLWATQRDDEFVESNGRVTQKARSNVGRSLLGGEIAYSAGAWEPYASGLLEYDFTTTSQEFAAGVLAPADDRSDLLLSVGLRYFGNNAFSGSLEYSTILGRENLDESSINASARWQF
jgi:hypothetical protein